MASQWLTVSPTSGSNNQIVDVTATTNESTTRRTSTVAITTGDKTQYVQVEQLYKPYLNQIGGSYMVSGEGGKIYISVHCPYEWSFVNFPDWVNVTDPNGNPIAVDETQSSTLDSGKVFTYNVSANPTTATRSFVQSIKFTRTSGPATLATVTITQDGKVGYITVTPTYILIEDDGGMAQITVESNTDWTVDATDEE